MLGFGLGLTHFGTRGGVSDTPDSSVSGAALMLASEPEGFAIDFSDASICIKDLTTPANSFASQGTVLNGALVGPGAKITYASPSPKLCKKSDGTYGYRAQNLYLNSESPANQSVTVVSGLPYIIAVTGTVSITLSGAAIGTVTAGNPITFTASTGTLTCGSTSGAGTVHLRRTPSNDDYLATSGSQVYALPYEWNTSGECQGVLIEPAATNLCTYSNDLTNSAWLTIYGQGGSDPTTQVTTAKTATGISGVANSATTVTASQNNAWIHQWVSAASAAHTNTVFLKRRTGTGAVTIAIGEKTGSELITNGTFTSDVSGWTNWGGGSIAYSSGTAAVTTDGSFQGAYQAITCTVGKLYAVSADVSVANGRIYVNDAASVSTSNLNTGAIAAGTSVKYYFVANATTMYILLSSASASTTANYDNVSVKEISETTVDLSSGGWVRGTIENKTVQNPIVGIKLATSGDAIDVQYGQIEATSYATSPIETFASTVTRAADNLSIATSAFPSLGSAGTLYVKGATRTGTTGNLYAVQLYTNGNNFAAIRNDSGVSAQGVVYNGGSLVAGPVIANWAAGATKKVAMRLNTDNTNICSGGTLGTNDTSCAMPSYTTLFIGSNNGNNNFNGHIHQIMAKPSAASDAELQAMTT